MRAPLNGVGRGSDRCFYYVDYCVLLFIFLFLNFARSFIFCSSVLVRYYFSVVFWFLCARASLSTAAESEDWLTRPRTFAVAQFALFCVCVSLSPSLYVRTENGESELGKESARNECVSVCV